MNRTQKSHFAQNRPKRRGRSKRGNNTLVQQGENPYSRNNNGRIPRTINSGMFVTQPNSQLITLKYIANQTVNQAGFTFASYSYNANGAYDVDPALGSTAMPGFNEWSRLFVTNRVQTTKVKAFLVNNENFPIILNSTWLSNNSFSGANTFPPSEYGNRFSKTRMLSAKGGMDKVQISEKMAMDQLFGDQSYWGDVVQFEGTAASNPSTLFQVVFGIASATGAPLVNGVSLYAEFEFCIKFFDPRTLTV